MAEQIISLQRIQLEARQAANRYSDVNAACPYPWGSTAATEFKREFERAINAQIDAIHDAGPDDESPTCSCMAQLTAEELDWNKCDSCGKPIYL